MNHSKHWPAIRGCKSRRPTGFPAVGARLAPYRVGWIWHGLAIIVLGRRRPGQLFRPLQRSVARGVARPWRKKQSSAYTSAGAAVTPEIGRIGESTAPGRGDGCRSRLCVAARSGGLRLEACAPMFRAQPQSARRYPKRSMYVGKPSSHAATSAAVRSCFQRPIEAAGLSLVA